MDEGSPTYYISKWHFSHTPLQKQTVMSTQKGSCTLCHCFTQDSSSLTETIYCILCNRSFPVCQVIVAMQYSSCWEFFTWMLSQISLHLS